jgi:hypothetical protein
VAAFNGKIAGDQTVAAGSDAPIQARRTVRVNGKRPVKVIGQLSGVDKRLAIL